MVTRLFGVILLCPFGNTTEENTSVGTVVVLWFFCVVGSTKAFSMNETEQKIIKIIAETLQIDKNKINLASLFVDDLGADSLDEVEIMLALEAAFECTISDEEAGKLSVVADVVNCIKKKLGLRWGFP